MKHQIEAYQKLNDLDSLKSLGKSICFSGMFGCETQEQGEILALQCLAEGMPPLELAKNYHLVKGRLTKRADAMLADFRRIGGKFHFHDLKDKTLQAATITFEDYVDYDVSFSIEDAEAAGLVSTKAGSPWVKTPAAMLRARLVSETLRAIAPEIVQGTYVPEELQDDAQVKTTSRETADARTMQDITPAKAETQPAAKSKDDIVIEAEVVDDEKDERNAVIDKLESLVKGDEKAVNNYWHKKSMIDNDLATWRDLDLVSLKKMLRSFDAFIKSARKGLKS